MKSTPPSNADTPPALPGHAAPTATIRGNLGVGGLILTALALNAPLAAMTGYVPLEIGLGLGSRSPLVYLAIMVLVLLFAVGLVAMAKRMEKPGAYYTYISCGLGPIPGLGAGFAAVTSAILLSVSAYIFCGMQISTLVANFGGPEIPWWAGGLATWVIATGVSMFNVDVSTKVLGVFLCLEVAIVVFWDLRVLFDGGPAGRALEMSGPVTSAAIGPALLFGLACLLGFEALQVFRSETRDPERTIPRASYLTIVLLTVFYAIGSWLYLVAFGTDAAVATAADPFSGYLGSLRQYAGALIADLANVILVTSAFAAILALQNIAARYTFSLARDGAFPRALGHAHPRHHAPTRAAAVVGGSILVFVLVLITLSIDAVTAYVATAGLGLWVVMVMMTATSMAVIGFFRRRPDSEATVWERAVAPALAAAGFGYVVYTATVGRDLLFAENRTMADIALLVMIAIVIAGMLYAVWLRSAKPEVYRRIGQQEDSGEAPVAELAAG
ncbi:APC family permease [Nocardia sp. NPDC002869]|uniref:APC family permease n=1 Tax=Nocardia sp. NPDC002869 TaxID=3161032 RepID=UPI00398CDD43